MTYELQKQHTAADSAAGNWANVKATLEAKTVETIDNRSWTWAMIRERIAAAFDADASKLVGGTIMAAAAAGDPDADSAWKALGVVGIDLSPADRQQVIDALAVAGSWPDALRDFVKALGRPKKSLTNNAEYTEQRYAADWHAGQMEELWLLLYEGDGGIKEAATIGKAELKAALLAKADEIEV